MLEVKIYEDGALVNQMEGQAVFSMAVLADHDDYEKVETTAWGTMPRDDFYNALASSCAQQIIDHHDSVKNSSEAIAWFMLMVRSYGSQYLAEKYVETEEAKGGNSED